MDTDMSQIKKIGKYDLYIYIYILYVYIKYIYIYCMYILSVYIYMYKWYGYIHKAAKGCICRGLLEILKAP